MAVLEPSFGRSPPVKSFRSDARRSVPRRFEPSFGRKYRIENFPLRSVMVQPAETKHFLTASSAIEICTCGQPMVQQPKPVMRRSSKGLTNPQRPNDDSSHILFGSPSKSGAWLGEQAPPALWCPARKRGGKGEKMYVSKPRFHHWLRRPRRATEVNKQGRTCGGVFRRHQIVVEERQRRL